MGKRAVVVTSVPNTQRIRAQRATKDDIRGQGIDGAVESYLAITGQQQQPTKR